MISTQPRAKTSLMQSGETKGGLGVGCSLISQCGFLSIVPVSGIAVQIILRCYCDRARLRVLGGQ